MLKRVLALSPLLLLLSVPIVLAQTLTTDKPPDEKAWEVVLKLGFPILMSALGPYATGLITSSFAKVHPSVQYVITSILTLIAGALVGQIPQFPLGSESAATMALAAGNTGQFMANSRRAEFHPKTDEAKVQIAKMSTAEKKEEGYV